MQLKRSLPRKFFIFFFLLKRARHKKSLRVVRHKKTAQTANLTTFRFAFFNLIASLSICRFSRRSVRFIFFASFASVSRIVGGNKNHIHPSLPPKHSPQLPLPSDKYDVMQRSRKRALRVAYEMLCSVFEARGFILCARNYARCA